MKYIKKENEKIVEAPTVFKDSEKTVIGYNKQSNHSMLLQHGYIKYDGNNPNSYIDIVDGVIIELPVPNPTDPTDPTDSTVFTKIQIRTACRALGLELKLNQLINSDDDFKTFWNDSLEIDLEYPMTKQALKTGTFTVDEIKQIIQYLQV